MLSLISTFLVGLFCCCGFANNRLNSVFSDSNIIVSSNDSFVCDDFRELSVSKISKPKQDLVYSDNYVCITGSELLTNSKVIRYCTDQNEWLFKQNTTASPNSTFTARFGLNYSQAFPTTFISPDSDIDYDDNFWAVSNTKQYFDSIKFTFINKFTTGHSNSGTYLVFEARLYNWYQEVDVSLSPVVRLYMLFTDDTNYTISYYSISLGSNWGVCCVNKYTAGPLFDLLIQSSFDFDSAYQQGVLAGEATGYQNGYSAGASAGYQNGYNDAIDDGSSYESTALTIFNGFISVGLLPVNVFLKILNFEVFGINVSGFVSALLTISLVIIIVRIILGGKNDK